MKSDNLEVIALMQKNTKNIRNLCILAHVDHGKTTLADCLLASNGIISARLAGKLRYLDSREDEQKRGITMKSSAISLYHKNNDENYLINLIDSPGHIDFSSEVSTAVRLCDGALVIVDVVEGVCPQTNAVLRQAWLEGIKPCLVLNKVDRLITELKLSPLEAFYHIQKILEQVNAVTGTLLSAHVMEQSTKESEEKSKQDEKENDGEIKEVFDWSSGLDEVDDDNLYFSPAQGNVVFASAIDGWAFRIEKFAELYATKLGISRQVLLKTLWGDYFLNVKAKKIFRGAFTKGKKPLFVQFILENIWGVYDAVFMNRDKEKIDKIIKSLNLKISARDSKFTDFRVHLHAVFRQWLPLSDAILDMVCEFLPSPLDITEDRVKSLMCSGFKKFETYPEDTQLLKEDFLKCSASKEAPVIVFVSKMLSVDKSALPQNKKRPLTKEEIAERYEVAKQKHATRMQEKQQQQQQETENSGSENDTHVDGDDRTEKKTDSSRNNNEKEENEDEDDDECFIAFARVFSGTLKKGAKLYVLGPKYDPSSRSLVQENKDPNTKEGSTFQFDGQFNEAHASSCEINDLYVMMGREFEVLEDVPAGNVCGINGLGNHILKSATVSTTLACPPFTAMTLEAKPIVRVAVEPKQPSQLPLLVAGMKLLNQADPCVQVLVQGNGEYVLVAAGEVHLQRCIDDLQQRFAKIKIRVSEPIVPFRETVVAPPKLDMVNEEISGINKTLAHHTQRLPAFMLKEIQSYGDTISKREEGADENNEKLSKEELTELKKTSRLKEKVGLIEAYTSNKQYLMCLHAKPLPETVLQCFENNVDLLKVLQRISSEVTFDERMIEINNLTPKTRQDIMSFYEEVKSSFDKSGKLWRGAADKLWAVGPTGSFNNVLLNNVSDYQRSNIWFGLTEPSQTETLNLRDYDSSIMSGFHLATQSGPMCEEPVMSVAFFVNEWKKMSDPNQDDATNSVSSSHQNYGPLSGQHISAFREGCRRAIMAQPMRLMAAMYTCDVQANTDVLGKMYSVLSKREGKVLSEDLKEGSDIFHIKAELPIAESFGFAEEIRKKTSGLASPQLVFSRWQVIDVDPFWIPTTEEEYELYGEKADSENQALKYVNKVRKRKGLYVEEKTVEHAEKQRTLKRNK